MYALEANDNSPQDEVCTECKVTKTTRWRFAKSYDQNSFGIYYVVPGEERLCNACGLRSLNKAKATVKMLNTQFSNQAMEQKEEVIASQKRNFETYGIGQNFDFTMMEQPQDQNPAQEIIEGVPPGSIFPIQEANFQSESYFPSIPVLDTMTGALNPVNLVSPIAIEEQGSAQPEDIVDNRHVQNYFWKVFTASCSEQEDQIKELNAFPLSTAHIYAVFNQSNNFICQNIGVSDPSKVLKFLQHLHLDLLRRQFEEIMAGNN